MKETKILGLIFDTKLTWIPHLNYLKTDCNKRLNIIRTLSKKNWGADQKLLISIILPESGDTPLDFKREQLTLIYASAIASTPSNPAYANIFLGKFQDLYMDHPRAVDPLYIRVKSKLQEINFELPLIARRRFHYFPFWDFSAPTIITV